jgi:PAS domain S-box-containing protein
MEKTVYVYGLLLMKRDAAGKFTNHWGSETKHRVSISLTGTAWQLLDEEAQKRGLSRSEVIEQFARQTAGPQSSPTVEMQAVREAGQKIADVLENITDGFVTLDRDWHCTYINRAAAQLLRRRPEALLGEQVWQVFPTLVGELAYRELHQALAEQVPVAWEEFEPTLQRWLEVNAYPSSEGVAVYFRDVTERKQAEAERERLLQELETERRRFEAVLQQMPAGVMIADAASGKLVLTNEQAKQIIGYDYEQSLELVDYEPIVPFVAFRSDGQRYAPEAMPLPRSLFTGEIITNEEVELRRSDNSSIFINVNSAPILDDQEQRLAAVIVFQDVSDRKRLEADHKRLEAELRCQEQQFKTLAENAPDIIARFDRNLRHVYVSPIIEQTTGLPATAYVGKTHREMGVPEEICQLWQQKMRQCFSTGQAHRFEFVFPAPRDRYYQTQMVPEFAPDGSVESLLAITRDVTDYKQIEQALRQSEERLRMALAAANMIVWDVDLNTNQVICSENAAEIWGFHRGLREEFVTLFHPDDRDKILQASAYAIAEAALFAVDYRILHPSGEIRWFNSQGSVCYSRAGEPQRIVGVSMDISDRKQMENSLRRANQQIIDILESTTDAFTAYDRQWRFTYVNQRAEQVMHCSRQELLGQCLWDIYPLAVGGKSYQEFHRAIAEQIPVSFETSDSRISNSWFEIHAYPLSDGLAVYFRDITEQKHGEAIRKQAEAAVRLSQERYRSLAESLPQLICMASAEGAIEYCNQSWIEYTGLTQEQSQGTGWQQAFRPDELPLILERWTEALENRDAYSIEFRIRRADGVYRWHLNRVVPIKTGDSTVGWLSTATDIDQQKQTEQTQRFLAQASQTFAAANLDLQTLLDSVTRLVSELTSDVCVLNLLSEDKQWLNLASCYHADSEVLEFVKDLLVRYPRRVDEGIGGQVMHTGEPLLMPTMPTPLTQKEFRAAVKPEYQLYFERFQVCSIMIVPLKVQGQAIGVLSLTRHHPAEPHTLEQLGLFQDLADRAAMAIANARLYQQAEQARQRAEHMADRNARLQQVTAALSESLTPTQVAEVIAQQSSAVFNAAAVMVAVLSETRTELEVIYTVGYDPKVSQLWQRFPISVDTPLTQAIRTKQPIWEEPLEARVARYPHLANAYTQYSYAAWISLPLIVEGRAVGGMSLSFAKFSSLSQDDRAFMLALTQQCAQAIARAQLYEAEQQARATAVHEAARSAAANRTKDEFLAVLSHELRTPLNPILGWAKLLQSGKLDANKTAIALETIERNAKLQVQLIEDLLDISRILQGKFSLKPALVDLATIIAAAQETVRLAAEVKSIQIEVDCQPSSVLGDAARLQQVVWNLLSNAVKFTPAGGRVAVCLKRKGVQAQIQVRDNGKGIQPEFLPYVFDYFRQADSSITRTFGGLGLGLAIVRHIVELHGGTVSAESPGEGQGSIFTVTLPLIQMIPSEPETTSTQNSLDLQGIRVLVVDDEVDNLELIQFVLEQAGATVTPVSSAQKALQQLNQFNPDLLLADIAMPQVDGYTLIRQIRELPPDRGGQIPAIALTAYAGEIDQQHALAAGFQKHLSKPIETQSLIETIAELVRQTQQEG